MFIDSPPVPYYGQIEPLRPGKVIQVRGQSQPNATFFAISLQSGPSSSFQNDIPLYLSLAYTPPPRVIRNSLINNQWGPEESFGGFPSGAGQPFDIMILVDPGQYRIALNGQHFTEYRHRIPFERVTHLSLTTDGARVDLLSVHDDPEYEPPFGDGGGGGGLYPNLGPGIPPPPYSSSDYSTGPPPPGYGGSYMGPPPTHQYSTAAPYPPAPGTTTYQGPPPGSAYPRQQQTGSSSGGIGNMLGGALAGVTGGLAANAIGNKIFGRHGHGMARSVLPGVLGGTGHGYPKKHKKSSAIPIAGLAAGAGAAALGATLLANPVKKIFKHKHKGSWHHGGWGSSSSDSSEEE